MIPLSSSPTCPPCMKLKAKLESAGLMHQITVKDISTLDARNEAVKLGIRTVPAIFNGENQITEDHLFELFKH